jgi:hypothetical protein
LAPPHVDRGNIWGPNSIAQHLKTLGENFGPLVFGHEVGRRTGFIWVCQKWQCASGGYAPLEHTGSRAAKKDLARRCGSKKIQRNVRIGKTRNRNNYGLEPVFIEFFFRSRFPPNVNLSLQNTSTYFTNDTVHVYRGGTVPLEITDINYTIFLFLFLAVYLLSTSDIDHFPRAVELVYTQIVVLSCTYSVQTRTLSLNFVCHISPDGRNFRRLIRIYAATGE